MQLWIPVNSFNPGTDSLTPTLLQLTQYFMSYVAVGVGIIYGSLLISIGRNPSQRDELLRYAFIGFSLVEVSGLIGLVISLLLLFGFDLLSNYRILGYVINTKIRIKLS